MEDMAVHPARAGPRGGGGGKDVVVEGTARSREEAVTDRNTPFLLVDEDIRSKASSIEMEECCRSRFAAADSRR